MCGVLLLPKLLVLPPPMKDDARCFGEQSRDGDAIAVGLSGARLKLDWLWLFGVGEMLLGGDFLQRTFAGLSLEWCYLRGFVQ